MHYEFSVESSKVLSILPSLKIVILNDSDQFHNFAHGVALRTLNTKVVMDVVQQTATSSIL